MAHQKPLLIRLYTRGFGSSRSADGGQGRQTRGDPDSLQMAEVSFDGFKKVRVGVIFDTKLLASLLHDWCYDGVVGVGHTREEVMLDL